jgi:hypothetical protein
MQDRDRDPHRFEIGGEPLHHLVDRRLRCPVGDPVGLGIGQAAHLRGNGEDARVCAALEMRQERLAHRQRRQRVDGKRLGKPSKSMSSVD